MSFGAVAASVAGAAVGGMMGGGGGGESQTASKEPWEPARKPLTNSIGTLQDLERYYQQNPFNRLQQQGYQNTFSDLDQFRNQMQPGLMNFANNAMTSNYQRGPRNSQVEAMHGGGMQQGNTRPQMMSQGPDGSYAPQGGGGLAGAIGQMGSGIRAPNGVMGLLQGGADASSAYNAMPQGQEQGTPGGLLGAAQGVFQAPSQGNYGLLDFAQLNPFTATNGIPKPPAEAAPAAKTPEQDAQEEWERLVRSGMAYQGSGA